MPYGKTSVQYPRMTSFCGTVNDDEFLVDQTGNRRFAVIPLDDDFYIDYAKIKAFNFVQLWAEINSIINELMQTVSDSIVTNCRNLKRGTVNLLNLYHHK